MNYLKAVAALRHKSRGSGFIRNVLKTTKYYWQGKPVIAHHGTLIHGLKNISIDGGKNLVTGLLVNNLGVPSDKTSLYVDGQLIIKDHFSIGRGTRISIGEKAVVTFTSGFINNNCRIAIEHKLHIGADCAIGWNVQIIDSDYHELTTEDKSPSPNEGVTIGNHVWIASDVKILKNVSIADGCVVALGSVVTKKFEEPNCLIGGYPAKVLKRNIQWK